MLTGIFEVVTCRIGSLEIDAVGATQSYWVTCRIGSLEIYDSRLNVSDCITCRIGSLETYLKCNY